LPVTIGRASRLELRRFGQAIAQALGEIGKRTVLLASGDLTHAAQPAGARRAGDGFRLDERLLKLLEGGRWDELFALDPALFTPQAPECAYHGMLVLAGAIEHSYPDLELLAYEHPTGVGYATVLAELDDPGEQDQVFNPAGWARQVADTFLQTDRLPAGPAHFPPDPRGVFVCLSRDGKRQVCVGSVLPREKTLAAEIARQTLAALRAYAQRHPISVDALNHLRFTVELLDRPERIQDLQALDPRVHGLILDDGEHQVVVLPGLGRLERPEDQLALALRKGRVQADRPYEMARFTAARHEEQAQPAW
jgi:AMMECR1 domain-containing protein